MEKINSQQNHFASKKSSAARQFFNLKNFNRGLFLAIIILSVYYIAGVNNLSIKGFALSDLKARKNKLVETNNRLELKALTSGAYAKIKEKIKNLNMVAVGEVNYLTAISETMAKR